MPDARGTDDTATGLRVDVFTGMPALVNAVAEQSLLGRAIRAGRLDIRVHDIRDHAEGVHRSIDDRPYGGGAGMVMSPGPLTAAVEAATPPRPVLALSPRGRTFDQSMATELAHSGGFSLVCARYEGLDERALRLLCDGEVSIGDYVINGGEIAACVILEATARLVPGVMGNPDSQGDESFGHGLLEYPQFTRPAEFRGHRVPEVLLNGDHERVRRWRLAQAVHLTRRRRPDLIESRGGLTPEEASAVGEFGDEYGADDL